MKVVILAGGLGTRLSEETDLKPKPMVEIGGKPILWHIMKIYGHYGFNDFVILLGYKGYYIKEYFANYFLHQSDVTIDLQSNSMEIHDNKSEPWKVTLVDTGLESQTGSRIKKAQRYIGTDAFLLTYGDGVSDIDVNESINFHKNHGKSLTMTAVRPEARFGGLELDSNEKVTSFKEKPQTEGGWINGGFFVCEPKVFDYLSKDENCIFEQGSLQKISENEELFAYKHHGFWQPMDTLRDNHKLNDLWKNKKAPWKVW